MQHKNIIVVGAGPAGLSLACALEGTGLSVLLVERNKKSELADPRPDGREIALTHASYDLMQKHGTWQRLNDENISDIKFAKVLNGVSPYSLNFGEKNNSADPLGYLVPNDEIRRVYYAEVGKLDNVDIMDEATVVAAKTNDSGCKITLENGETLTSDMLVVADSRFSSVRKMVGIAAQMNDFSRVAIVCRMKHTVSHEQTAIEFFKYGQTMAILPMNNQTSSVVITLRADKSQAVLDMSDEQFNSYVEKHLEGRLGEMALTGERYSYPLVGVHANRFMTNRVALIGDAAVGMHPVTAHGFNLGLASTDELSRQIKNALAKNEAFYSEAVLSRYQSRHMLATRPLYHGTNAMVGLFTNEHLPVKALRNLTLRIANNLPPLKHLIVHKLTEKKLGRFGLR